MRRDGGDYAAGLTRRGFQTADDVILLPTHGTTHMDALAHVADEDRLYNGFPFSTVRSNGAAHCGIDKLPALVGRGVLLDICALRGERSEEHTSELQSLMSISYAVFCLNKK